LAPNSMAEQLRSSELLLTHRRSSFRRPPERCSIPRSRDGRNSLAESKEYF
jgi:hypothetical protein